MSLEWLKSPLICNGRIVRSGLTPDSMTNADLPDICLRMHLILETIEFDRCEGRLMNVTIFDSIDTMESKLRFETENQLSDWRETISRFGEHYNLAGNEPIDISCKAINEHLDMAKALGIDLLK